MGEGKEIHTFCGVCSMSCAVIAEVENGKLVSVKPDKGSPFRHEICPGGKGPLTLVGTENHPDRLKYPLKRVGERGEGKWERISWDEALNTVSEKLLDIKNKFGPEHVAVVMGEPKSMETIFAHRFATAFGTPNVITPGGLCGIPRAEAFARTMGRSVVCDVPANAAPPGTIFPKVLIGWGGDLRRYGGRHRVKLCKEHGVKIVVIEPMRSYSTEQADWWIRVRPGGDGALAFGLLKVIIDEELYDKDFVDHWTIGFEHIKEEVKTFSLDDVERISWVPKRDVIKLARMYATCQPVAIQEGNSLDFMKFSFDLFRVNSTLRAITRNLNVAGGDVFVTPSAHARPGHLMLFRQVGRDTDKMLAKDFISAVKHAYTPYQSLVKANLEGDPYTVNAGICCLTNPIVSYPDSRATLEAFMKMDFIVVLELFHTPTTAIADIVLPAAWTWEDETIGYWGQRWEEYRSYPKVVDPPGEAWSDAKIFNEIAKKMGMGEYFWDNENDALAELLEGSGITFEEFLKKRKLPPRFERKSPEEEPYRTRSGKVEIYCESLKELGLDPLPRWERLARTPGGDVTEEYPLVLSSAKENMFMLTGFKMIEGLRRMVPDPLVRLNPDTAQKLGMKDGEWICIETPKGRITQKLAFDPDLDPRVVMAAWGWWFPEDGPETLYGWDKSNFNVLTTYEVNEKPAGSPEVKGLPCRVCKA
ncbi:molybdopterin-dependent oxidoreductase [Chloroflexota bacterium]